MATVEQIVKTPYGATPIKLLKCDQCGSLSTEYAVLGWVRLENLGAVISTLGGDGDLSGDYCSPACLMTTMIEQGISAQQGSAVSADTDNSPSDKPTQEATNDENRPGEGGSQ